MPEFQCKRGFTVVYPSCSVTGFLIVFTTFTIKPSLPSLPPHFQFLTSFSAALRWIKGTCCSCTLALSPEGHNGSSLMTRPRDLLDSQESPLRNPHLLGWLKFQLLSIKMSINIWPLDNYIRGACRLCFLPAVFPWLSEAAHCWPGGTITAALLTHHHWLHQPHVSAAVAELSEMDI